jgi:hypothetical protein
LYLKRKLNDEIKYMLGKRAPGFGHVYRGPEAVKEQLQVK